MRALTFVMLIVALLISAWAGVRSTGLRRPVPASVGSVRAYCDTGRGIFLPCASFEPDSAEI